MATLPSNRVVPGRSSDRLQGEPDPMNAGQSGPKEFFPRKWIKSLSGPHFLISAMSTVALKYSNHLTKMADVTSRILKLI